MGHEPVVMPLFDVIPIIWDAPSAGAFDAVVMTSANAARHGGAGLAQFSHLPLFAVGKATADAARAAGFADVRVGDGDAAAIGPQLAGRVVHFSGTEYRQIPTHADVTAVPVYQSLALSPAALPPADCALVHSPRAGARLAELASDRATIQIVAISPAAARACGTGWAEVHSADHPSEHAMLACLARVCEAPVTERVQN